MKTTRVIRSDKWKLSKNKDENNEENSQKDIPDMIKRENPNENRKETIYKTNKPLATEIKTCAKQKRRYESKENGREKRESPNAWRQTNKMVGQSIVARTQTKPVGKVPSTLTLSRVRGLL